MSVQKNVLSANQKLESLAIDEMSALETSNLLKGKTARRRGLLDGHLPLKRGDAAFLQGPSNCLDNEACGENA